jgi:hypothetical protein
MATLRQTKKGQPVPAGACDLARNGTQRPIAFGLIFEAIFKNRDHDAPIPILAREKGSDDRQPRVPGPDGSTRFRFGFAASAAEHRLGHAQAQIGVVGNFQGSPARPFAQVLFGPGLQPIGDAAEQKAAIRRARFFAENVAILDPQSRASSVDPQPPLALLPFALWLGGRWPLGA